MTTIAPTSTTAETRPADPTRKLLVAGAVAGPVYVVTGLAQALTREGFDLTKHPWSMLTLGENGWIQTANFAVTGLLIIAGAVGLRRRLATGKGATWTPRLLAVFGASFIAAGVFVPDPALGFPAGTPDGPGTVSLHGMLHFVAAGIGFTCFAAACFVLARRYTAEARRGFARYSRGTGIAFLGGFLAVGSGAGSAAAILAFTATVIAVFAWLTAVSVDRSH